MPRLRWYLLILFFMMLPLAVHAQNRGLVKAEKYLSLRSKPNTNSAVVDRLLRFQPVQVLERKDKWARVKTVREDPKEGWVLEAYLSNTGFATVDNEKINVRSGPGTNYPIIMNYSKPYPVYVLDVSADGWLLVLDFDGDRGWIHPGMMSFTPQYVITRLPTCNVRAGGGETYDKQPIVFTAERGVYLEVLEEKDGWLRVRHVQDEGWVSSKIVFGWLDEEVPKKSR